MSSDNKGQGPMEMAAEEVKVLGGKIYDDAAKPAVVHVGKTLELVVEVGLAIPNMVLGGAKVGLDKLSAALKRKLGGVPEDRLLRPPGTIAAPAALQCMLLGDGDEVSELREMFENLLATSMDSQIAASAHPAFVSIISQLTPDEARILRSINRTVVATMPHQFEFSERTDADWDRVGGDYISTQFERFCADAGAAHPSLSSSYLDNLLRLKLLKEDIWNEGKFWPHEWTDHAEIEAHVTNVTGRSIRLSAFGEQFLMACVRQ
jgi:hypothetical protein